MAPSKVIVFGPTGAVASVAAVTAQELGSKVYLAMRDPSKTIAGLSAEQEKAGGFERVKADLSDPESVKKAVSETGAKTAFLYLVFGSRDGMKSAVEALKAGGIEFVVFLSSMSVQGDRRGTQPEDLVAFAHAQVEISIEDAFGPRGFVAVRPGYFASNGTRHKGALEQGDVKILFPEIKFDWIAYEDMGRVAGTFLAKGPASLDGLDGDNYVNLTGPEMISQRNGVLTIAKALGKEVKISETDEKSYLEGEIAHGVPPPIANYLAQNLKAMHNGEYKLYESETYHKSLGQVEKQTGKPPMTLQEWANKNTHLFKV